MVNVNGYREGIDDFLQALGDERLPEINFDELSRQLTEISDYLSHCAARDHELELLREDYRRRIGGMIKAIAVVGRKPDALTRAAEEIDALSAMSAEELIAAYRRVSARFRDAFPTSFGGVQMSRQRPRDLAAYK
ncbi:MAG: hypothetical protein D6741_03530 [Planctomycetota bacterium]|nr:MAG: hypothetical protein D6741_03530 [Planctomycetota bacterium]